MIKDKEILILGGTGSLSKALIKLLLQKYKTRGIRIYSRDEYKQWQFRNELKSQGYNKGYAFLIGDIRDKERLNMAMRNVDTVINCAAMKQVPACEYNPFEAVKTNIIGSKNIIECAIGNKVSKVMHISTDKAVDPVNLYGNTKAVAESLFINGNIYTGGRDTIMSCCRYGNVIGSRGSVVELFKQQREKGLVYITDERMTRFWITLDQVADFIIRSIQDMQGEEIFIPKMPSMSIMNLKETIAPDCKHEIIGIRKGEKLHETLIAEHETIYMDEQKDRFVLDFKDRKKSKEWSYASDNNEWQLTIEELRGYV